MEAGEHLIPASLPNRPIWGPESPRSLENTEPICPPSRAGHTLTSLLPLTHLLQPEQTPAFCQDTGSQLRTLDLSAQAAPQANDAGSLGIALRIGSSQAPPGDCRQPRLRTTVAGPACFSAAEGMLVLLLPPGRA